MNGLGFTPAERGRLLERHRQPGLEGPLIHVLQEEGR